MTLNLELMPLYVLAGIILLMLAWIIRLEWRLKKLLAGKKGESLEGVITELVAAVRNTDKVNEEIQQHLIGVEQRLRRSIQHVKTDRFNPFREQGLGGNQSFAVALLDEHGDGVVLSSLYTRDKVSVYAKPVKHRQSEYELTNEERAVLSQ
jgi:hypothetical protein